MVNLSKMLNYFSAFIFTFQNSYECIWKRIKISYYLYGWICTEYTRIKIFMTSQFRRILRNIKWAKRRNLVSHIILIYTQFSVFHQNFNISLTVSSRLIKHNRRSEGYLYICIVRRLLPISQSFSTREMCYFV